jgi:hypothetical protein
MKKLVLLLFCLVVFYQDALCTASIQGYRWRNDNGSETSATYLEPQNSVVGLTHNQNVRLRMSVENSAGFSYPAGPPANNIMLGWSDNPNGPFIPVGDDLGMPFVFSSSSNIANGEATTSQLNSNLPNFVAGNVYENSGEFGLSIPAFSRKEYEFCIKPTLNAITNIPYFFTLMNRGGSSSERTVVGVVTNGGCMPVHNLAVDGNGVVCLGNNIIGQYTASSYTFLSTATYSWTGPNGFTASTASISPTVAGTYNVTVSNGSTCTATASKTLILVQSPGTTTITGVNTICNGSNTSFTAAAQNPTQNTTYTWTGPVSNLGNTATINNLTVAGNYSCMISNGNGCTSSSSRNLTVNAIPTNASINGDNAICSSAGELDMTATASSTNQNTTYSWTGPNSFTANSANITITEPGTYNCIINNTPNCSVSVSKTITLQNATAYYLDQDGDGFGNPDFIFMSCTAPFGFVTNNLDCNDDNELMTTFPTAPTISSIGSTQICQGASVVLTGNNGGTWSNFETTNSITVNQAGVYLVVVSNSCGTAASNVIEVTVVPCNQSVQGSFTAAQCGFTNQLPGGLINCVSNVGATSYLFKVYTVGGSVPVFTQTRNTNSFLYPNVGGQPTPLNWGTQYQVTVTPQGSSITGIESNRCTTGLIAFPTPSTVQATKLRTLTCTSSPASAPVILPTATIRCAPVSQASSYQFKIVNTANPSNNYLVNATFLNELNLSTLSPALTPGAVYEVSMRATVLGVQASNFGQVCLLKIAGGARFANTSNEDSFLQNEQFTVSVAPNPAHGQVIFNSNDNCNISIFDILGKKVFESKTTDASTLLDINHLSNGMYMIIANNGNKTQTLKLIVE